MRTRFFQLARVATLLTLIVVVVGAWVRLTDAGLGCPDWPGCYGVLTVPQSEEQLARAEQMRPDRAVDVGAAWREMIHRYLAGALGLVVFALAFIAWRNRRDPKQPVALPMAIAALIIFQSLLGMWTVTLLLKPAIVLAHLIGGMTTLALLFLLMRQEVQRPEKPPRAPRRLAGVALAVVVAQIALGGWVSTNYAALACPDFPTCQTQWWPENMDFAEGFVLWRGLGVDYEFGILDSAANTAIHMAHRIGAVVTVLVLGWLAVLAFTREQPARVRTAAGLMVAALSAQVLIGIFTVVLQLPLWLATAHNGMAALLLLAVINLNFVLHRAPERAAAA